ncbi:MAG TPA: hypothetical protein PKG67_01365 [Turneriella sp.]|nr:hypothetical protein [Turneriella sp.]HNE20801.1 hypothetical protein [Turneriella sp.]HNL55420.1 hypothetical protein [Turneriella sp.]HNM99061.1 hypothetical protein [Turneriella sp.]
MVVYPFVRVTGQVESSHPGPEHSASETEILMRQSPVGERIRQRTLSANVKAAERFFTRHLPAGWKFTTSERQVLLRRVAPVYALAVEPQDYLTSSKSTLLKRAKTSGKRKDCIMEFKVERHDDDALMRQKLRLYKEIRRDTARAFDRLALKRLCGTVTPEACAKLPGQAGTAAQEFMSIRAILEDKLEAVPLYRIGTLYLFPLKHQCVTAKLDWYTINSEYPAGESIFPLEAREEIEVILRNLEQLKLSE